MGHRIFLHLKAAKYLKKLDENNKERIKKELTKLNENPKKGKHLLYCPFWSLRIGKYRAIYEINFENKKIIVLFIGERKDVYSDFRKLI